MMSDLHGLYTLFRAGATSPLEDVGSASLQIDVGQTEKFCETKI
jgi:hypothetical protein